MATLFGDERSGLGARIVAQAQHCEAAEVDVLPKHGLVVVSPVHLDIPDAAVVTLVELDIDAVLVLQDAVEFVIPFFEAIVRAVEAESLDRVAGLVDH